MTAVHICDTVAHIPTRLSSSAIIARPELRFSTYNIRSESGNQRAVLIFLTLTEWEYLEKSHLLEVKIYFGSFFTSFHLLVRATACVCVWSYMFSWLLKA